MSFAAIYVPDFPLQAVVRTQPELRQQAVAILDGAPPVLTVIAVNDKARRAGVTPGMTKMQAMGWLASLELRPRSLSQEVVAHAALLDCAQAFSPRVEDAASDTVVLDLAGLERLFGPPAKMARDLARRASEVGLEANVAVAGNPDAVIHAARGFPEVTVIPLGKEAERLGELPVDVLDLPLEMLETLDRWGVRTFRALAALPEVAVSERLGQEGLRLQKLARGAGTRPLVPAQPALHFEEVMELEHPLALLEPLAFILGRLLEQLCARLAARALATNELRLRLELEVGDDNPVFGSTLRLPVPMLDGKIFLKLLQLDLKSHPPGAPVVKVTLAAEPVPPRRAQGGLFLPLSPEPERMELTLARIAGVVGKDRIGSPEVLDTHRPDAFRMMRFAAAPQELKPFSESDDLLARLKSCPSSKPVMALRVFRPPLRARVELRAGRPVRVSAEARGLRGEVISLAGPWRTSGEWWTGAGWRRDEWDIALANGEAVVLLRIFKDLASGEWFVEGTYD